MSTITSTPSTSSAVPATRRWIVRALAAMVLAMSTVLGLGLAPSQAMIIGGPPPNVAGKYDALAYCGSGYLRITPEVSVQANQFNGQYMVWRYQLQNNRGYVGTSGWSGPQWVGYNNYETRYLSTATISTAIGVQWTVYVEVGYWNGSRYTYTGWYRAAAKQANYSQLLVSCWT